MAWESPTVPDANGKPIGLFASPEHQYRDAMLRAQYASEGVGLYDAAAACQCAMRVAEVMQDQSRYDFAQACGLLVLDAMNATWGDTDSTRGGQDE